MDTCYLNRGRFEINKVIIEQQRKNKLIELTVYMWVTLSHTFKDDRYSYTVNQTHCREILKGQTHDFTISK